MKMKEYKVRYKLFSRSRQTRTEKVRAANQFIAAPEMSWQEKLFWAMDKPLHMFAYIIFFLSLSLIATWVLQAGQAGGC